VNPDVDAQTIEVVTEESVSEEGMLEALNKWASASGKSVSLADL